MFLLRISSVTGCQTLHNNLPWLLLHWLMMWSYKACFLSEFGWREAAKVLCSCCQRVELVSRAKRAGRTLTALWHWSIEHIEASVGVSFLRCTVCDEYLLCLHMLALSDFLEAWHRSCIYSMKSLVHTCGRLSVAFVGIGRHQTRHWLF